MKDSILNKQIRYFISICVILIIWTVWSFNVDNKLVAPSIIDTLQALGSILTSTKSYSYILGTVGRLIASVSISVLFGVVLGYLSGMFKRLEEYLYPIVTMLRTIPIIAIILIIWMAVGSNNSPIIIAFLIVFPISYQAVNDGVKELNKNEFMDVYKLDTKLNLFVIMKVYLPLLSSYIKLALIQSIGLGVKVLVMAEFTAGTKNSIGLAILKANNAIEYNSIFAWTIILITFVLIIEFFVNYTKNRIKALND